MSPARRPSGATVSEVLAELGFTDADLAQARVDLARTIEAVRGPTPESAALRDRAAAADRAADSDRTAASGPAPGATA